MQHISNTRVFTITKKFLVTFVLALLKFYALYSINGRVCHVMLSIKPRLSQANW